MISVGVTLSACSACGTLPEAATSSLPRRFWVNLDRWPPGAGASLDRNPGVMSQRPRPRRRLYLTGVFASAIRRSGKGLLALAILGLALPGWTDSATARTAMFQFLAIGQLFYVYPSRHTSVFPLPNRAVHAAVALGVMVQLIVGMTPGPARLLSWVPLDSTLWGVVFAASALSWALAESLNRWLWRDRIGA